MPGPSLESIRAASCLLLRFLVPPLQTLESLGSQCPRRAKAKGAGTVGRADAALATNPLPVTLSGIPLFCFPRPFGLSKPFGKQSKSKRNQRMPPCPLQPWKYSILRKPNHRCFNNPSPGFAFPDLDICDIPGVIIRRFHFSFRGIRTCPFCGEWWW